MSRATSLGPKPFFCFCFFFVFFCVLFFFLFFGGGFKGQVRCPKGPPHLALNRPFLIEKTCFPPKKGISAYHWVSPFVSLSLFWPPPFSLPLSLSLSCSFLSSFLPVFFLLLSFGSFFVSFFIFLSSLLLFHEKNNMKLLNFKNCFINPFSFLVSCLVFSFKCLFYCLCFFLIFIFVSCSTSMFCFQKRQVNKQKTIFEKRGVATKRFLMNLCFAKCEKLSFFWAIFCQFLVAVQKALWNRYFSTFP